MRGLSIQDIQKNAGKQVSGGFTDFLGERYYKISNVDAMTPFFMTIVSSSDIWNYVWSNGGLTAGRINSDHALFPYYTADKVSDGRSYTGPCTAIKVRDEHTVWLWEPFSDAEEGLWKYERNIYKNTSGSKVYFEEINHDLALGFQYGWMSSDRFGLVRHCRILNRSGKPVSLEILDGCRNILPACVSADFQNSNSVLLDAYKKTDLETEHNIALFSVSSIVTDKAEPNEGLLANIGWFSDEGKVYLSPDTPTAFRSGRPLPADSVVKGQRPAFFLFKEARLDQSPSGAEADWYQVFDTSLDVSQIVSLGKILDNRAAATKALEEDVAAGVSALERYIALADGLQETADLEMCVHHEANVLFNVMRGGVFADNTRISISDFVASIRERNTAEAAGLEQLVCGLGPEAEYAQIEELVRKNGNPQQIRLFLEYLPLTFSRRHGDPSRPWNRFSIELKDKNGNRKLNYQGNWRDIFQNWEALALSYPMYIDNFIAKFLNATTCDGFNPYRITRSGIDWEVVEPDNPWSNIGYWGDHQVIYLAKLLEVQYHFNREQLEKNLSQPCYSTGNVPYRLKKYTEMLANPRSTIIFDHKLHATIEAETERYGTDAKLIRAADGSVALTTMTDKILAIILAKMASYVPLGGIWLNTQRPEWNDANNALAGYGLSMVTLYYLRRFLVFLVRIYTDAQAGPFAVTGDTADFFRAMSSLFAEQKPETIASPAQRRSFMDKTGSLFETWRETLYRQGYASGNSTLSADELIRGFSAFLSHIEAAIRANERSDGLYHSYNTMNVRQDDGIDVEYLPEMLEGQVAVLSSGYLTPEAALSLCRTLKTSALFREDQYSYILYPEKELPHFCDKNNASEAEIRAIPFLSRCVDSGDCTIGKLDANRVFHFNPQFRNALVMESVLQKAGQKENAKESELQAVRDLYEKTFNHRSFTGRSGTFYAYEGLGSIYWHMVAKLMLAVQENCLAAKDPSTRKALTEVYYDVRAGIGFNKAPEVYGAFPTDPYSHTPAGQGAKQPGMTGQVKEEILTRWTELGIRVEDGILSLDPEFLGIPEIREDGTLRFSWCNTLFVYRLENAAANTASKPDWSKRDWSKRLNVTGLTVTKCSGETAEHEGNRLTREDSAAVFSRSGTITEIEARIRLL